MRLVLRWNGDIYGVFVDLSSDDIIWIYVIIVYYQENMMNWDDKFLLECIVTAYNLSHLFVLFFNKRTSCQIHSYGMSSSG